MDTRFQEPLAWLAEDGQGPSLRPLRVWDRGEYGWVEKIERGECEDRAQAARFFERQGAYLALFHALGATDLARLAIAGPDDVTWIGVAMNHKKWLLAPLKNELYSGLPGVVLFLAYLGAVTGERTYTDLAERGHRTVAGQIAAGQHNIFSAGLFGDGRGSSTSRRTFMPCGGAPGCSTTPRPWPRRSRRSWPAIPAPT